MDKNILVIGNGFDLYHGLPTSYIDFVNYTWRMSENKFDEPVSSGTLTQIQNIQKNMFINYFQKVAEENDTWIDCEQEIKRFVSAILNVVIPKIRLYRNHGKKSAGALFPCQDFGITFYGFL